MYYVIIVVLLNIVCAALIAAPSHPFVRLQWNSWGLFHHHWALLNLSTFVIMEFTLFQSTWSSHDLGRREILTWKRKAGPFSPAALLELIWIFEILTRNRRTLEELQVQTRVCVSLLLSCPCASLELKLLALTSTSWWKMLASISKEVKCSQHIGKTAPSSAPSFS